MEEKQGDDRWKGCTIQKGWVKQKRWKNGGEQCKGGGSWVWKDGRCQ